VPWSASPQARDPIDTEVKRRARRQAPPASQLDLWTISESPAWLKNQPGTSDRSSDLIFRSFQIRFLKGSLQGGTTTPVQEGTTHPASGLESAFDQLAMSRMTLGLSPFSGRYLFSSDSGTPA